MQNLARLKYPLEAFFLFQKKREKLGAVEGYISTSVIFLARAMFLCYANKNNVARPYLTLGRKYWGVYIGLVKMERATVNIFGTSFV